MKSRDPRMIVWRNGRFGLQACKPVLVSTPPGWTCIGPKDVIVLAALVAVSAVARVWGAVTGQRISWH